MNNMNNFGLKIISSPLQYLVNVEYIVKFFYTNQASLLLNGLFSELMVKNIIMNNNI